MRWCALLVTSFMAGASSAAEPVDYLHDIKPILSKHCYSCHGALRQRSGLRLDTAEFTRKGGKTGPALVAGKSDESVLIEAVTGNGRRRMPPKEEAAALSAQQVAKLKAWIDQGAQAPEEPIPEDPRNHWAFRKPVRRALPIVKHRDWVSNPIDAFVAAEHEKRDLQPRPRAGREILVRRVYLDLIGLPPTRAELHAFLNDPSTDAYEKVVDRLLANPQHGERWGRHWMDVWRYSDWYGRRSVSDWWNSASQIWRWRDWIVKSLNADKGYDRMVQEMLAADETAPEDDDVVVATGYLARSWYALNPNQWMRDQVEHTAKAFLGLTLHCAHCHDHKYDPITQEEYFRFRAFFEPLDLRQDRVAGEADPGPFQKYEYVKLRKPVRTGLIRVIDEHANAKTYMYAGGDERNRLEGKPPVSPGAPAFLGGDRLEIAPIELPLAVYYPGVRPFIQEEEFAKAEGAVRAAKEAVAKTPVEALATARLATAEAELHALQARIAADNARYSKGPGNAEVLARVASQVERTAALLVAEEKVLQAEAALTTANAKNDPKTFRQAEVQTTAAHKAAGAARQALTANSDKYTPLSPIYPRQSTGRRRALAEWIADSENPLTARVAVNHLWMRHFGRPLVETVSDFGRNGKQPTHPELLDWLAVELMDSGWSMKHLHRLIVTSDAYRMQSGAGTDAQANLAADPDNRYLWQFPRRRLEAEAVRDSILHAAGQVDPRMGGQELEVETEPTSRRRSLYFSSHPEGGHPKFLAMFDPPDQSECYRRSESLVPQQALALTNSEVALQHSRVLARRIWSEQPAETVGEEAFLGSAFEHVLSRRPTDQEMAVCLDFLREQAELFRTANPKPGKEAGSGSPAVEPQMRAREGLIRALFSHDEFVTIR